MMKEIKFRAWDKNQKWMFYPSSISWKDGKLWVCNSRGENRLEYELINPNAELMQYTGLKDKNGKEIYEGDIVKYRTFRDALLDELNEDTDPGIALVPELVFVEVKQTSAGWSPFVSLSHGDESINLSSRKGIEIVGNIYENKELINNES